MILSLLFLAGALFLGAAALRGALGTSVVLDAAWARLAFGLAALDLLLLGLRGLVRLARMRGAAAQPGPASGGAVEVTTQARVRFALLLATGVLLLALAGWAAIGGDGLRLDSLGMAAVVVTGGVTGGLGALLSFLDPKGIEQRKRAAQASRAAAAAAAVPPQVYPCSACGSSDLAHGVSVSADTGGLFLATVSGKDERTVADVCRRCGAVRLRVLAPDREWSIEPR